MIIEQLATAIDCEGYIGINRLVSSKGNSNPQFSARITLGMIHPAIPYALRDTFGSTIWIDKSGSHSKHPLYRWSIVGNVKTKPILEALLPHLIVKKQQALNALAMIEYIHANPPTKITGGNFGTKQNTEQHVLETFHQKGKALNHVTPAETERENPAMGCDSPTLCESIRENSEACSPLVQ